MFSFADCFSRNLGAITADQQQILQTRRAAVIGCGGLGGHVIELLARIGVGQLHLYDPDVFSESNLNRQLGALTATLGRSKTAAMAERAAAIHPFTRIHTHPCDFRDHPAAEPLPAEVAIDCLDTIPARLDLAALCDRWAIPLVHGAVNGWFGQVGVHLPGSGLIGRLYPQGPVQPTQPPPVLSFTVALVASLQAAEAIKLLLGLESPLANTWLHIDLKENEFVTLAG